MLQGEDTTNISEFNDFCTACEKGCATVLWIIHPLKLTASILKYPNQIVAFIYGTAFPTSFLNKLFKKKEELQQFRSRHRSVF